jgi:hypothetical protein
MAATTSTWTPNGSETNGTPITPTNSGGVHGDAWDQVDIGTGSTITYDTTSGYGAFSGRNANLTAVGTGKARLYRNLASDTDDVSITFTFIFPTFTNTAAVQIFGLFNTANTGCGSVNLRSDGQVQLLEGGGTVVKTFNVANHILLAGTRCRARFQWHKGAAGTGKIAFGFVPSGTDFTVTNAGYYEETALANSGTLQAHFFHIGSNASTAKFDFRVSNVIVKTDSYADITPAAPGPPVATVMSKPASRGAGSVTVTGGITVPDGSVGTIAARVLTAAQGAALTTPIVCNPPNNPTITPTTSGIGTLSATISATFPAIPGRYHVQVYGTKNDGTATNDSAVVEINIYGASGQYEVKPFQVISSTGFTANGAATAIATQTDANDATDLRITGPANNDIWEEWCAFGPDSIEFQWTIDADASPSTTAQVTVYKADGVTEVYAETAYTISTSGTSSAWVHNTVVDAAGLLVATAGTNREKLRTRLRINQ